MEKNVMTTEGFAALQAALYSKKDSQLQEEARLVSNDALGWIAAHFELTVGQLEVLRGMDTGILALLGNSFAQAILTRRPFAIIGLIDVQPAVYLPDAGVVIHSSISVQYGNAGSNATGEVTACFTLIAPDK